MKRTGLLSCLLFFLACAVSLAAPEPPKVLSPSGILMDEATGQVLWAHNPDERRPMASTTKIMTALLILEYGKMDDVVTVSKNAASVKESSLHLKVGEHLTLRDLLFGMILRSANDACVVAAEHIDGSVPAFVAHMNARAAELGCRNTHFANPNGLNAEGHYSSARDLATIARAALAFPLFREIAKTPDYTIERSINHYDTDLTARDHWFLTHYAGADGVKTGYTHQAGHCFVGAATRKQFQLLSVLLHSPNVKKETCALLDWGFKYYRGGVAVKPGRVLGNVRVVGGGEASVPVMAAVPVPVTVAADAPPVKPELGALQVLAPVKPGQMVGRAPLMAGSHQVGWSDVVATQPVGLSPWRIAGRATAGTAFLSGAGLVIGALTENSRRRRRRVASRSRRPDPRRTRPRERADRADR